MSFKATIYKVGINAVVEVPMSVTAKMKPVKGYIPVTGKINGHEFRQTLCPIKNSPFRLYVNVPMLKGGGAKLGDTATFSLKEDKNDRTKDFPMVPALKKELVANKLMQVFDELTFFRRKEILRYLARLKNEETRRKNIQKVISQLKLKKAGVTIP